MFGTQSWIGAGVTSVRRRLFAGRTSLGSALADLRRVDTTSGEVEVVSTTGDWPGARFSHAMVRAGARDRVDLAVFLNRLSRTSRRRTSQEIVVRRTPALEWLADVPCSSSAG